MERWESQVDGDNEILMWDDSTKKIKDLEIGDEIRCKGNETEKVTSIEFKEVDADTDLHNFTLDGDHTYIANNYVAHNKDPLAQTFMTNFSGGAFLLNVELFFSQKDNTLPVWIELRNTVNGYPGPKLLPFGSV